MEAPESFDVRVPEKYLNPCFRGLSQDLGLGDGPFFDD
jgi:hypothetical protein